MEKWQKWQNYYIERMGTYHLYSKNEYGIEHATFDMFGKLKKVTLDADGIFDGWPVSVVSIVGSTNKKTEVSVDGESFLIKREYIPCKDVLVQNVELHNRTVPLHYTYKDKQGYEHPRMIFVVDKDKYNKKDIMDIYRRAG